MRRAIALNELTDEGKSRPPQIVIENERGEEEAKEEGSLLLIQPEKHNLSW